MSKTKHLAEDIYKAAITVENYRSALDSEKLKLEQAQKKVTMVLNELNHVQKKFDTLVKKFRENNKKGTDWDWSSS